MLIELRQTSITYATTKASEKRQRWKQLEGDLHAAEAIVSSHPPNACFLNNLNELKCEYTRKLIEETEGSRVRSRALHVKNVDKPTRMFFAMEASRAKKMWVDCV